MQNQTLGKLNSSDQFLLLLSFIYMLHNAPYLAVRMPAMVYAGVIIMLFVYVCVLFSRQQSVLKFIIPIFALYLLDVIFANTKGASSLEDYMRIVSSTLQILLLPMLAGYVISTNKVKLALYLFCSYIAIESVTYITSIIADSSVPGIIRMNPTELMNNDEATYAIKTSMNVGNFDTVYGCAILTPIFVLLVKWRQDIFNLKILRVFTIIYLAFMVYFVYVSQFTTALIGTLLMSCVLLCPKRLSVSYFKRSLIIGFFAFVAIRSLLPIILHTVADGIDSEIMAERFEGIAVMLEGGVDTGSGDIDERRRVYETSINTIFDTALLGSWSKAGSGGHSFILDHIALYGIVGLLLLVIYYKKLISIIFKRYQDTPWGYYYLYGLIGATFFYFLNPSALFAQLLFCYPLSAFLINYKLQN